MRARSAHGSAAIAVLICASADLLYAQERRTRPARDPDRIPTVRELWNRFQATLPPFKFKVGRDEIVRSDTDPTRMVRRLEVKFYSQEIAGRRWGHPAVVFLPADPHVYQTPERRGRVVVIAQRSVDDSQTGPWRDSFLGSYGEPIAVRTGYPTMVLPVPGEYDESAGAEIDIDFLNGLVRRTKDPVDHDYFRLAVPYLRALDVFAELLHEPKIRAVIGGHSKRATSAITAAAADPDRVAGLVYMGNESIFANMEHTFLRAISPFYTQAQINCPVLYIGGTNEEGYQMFAINKIQARVKPSWTIEIIPNYRHSEQSETHFLDWQMWVSHIFEGRPITQIDGLEYEEAAEGTIFRAHVRSPNRIITAAVWYVYCDDLPFWRDLVWYTENMFWKRGDLYEGFVTGKLPDAWLVEVKDIAFGYPGYVSTVPQDITFKPTTRRQANGSRSRHWAPKPRPRLEGHTPRAIN